MKAKVGRSFYESFEGDFCRFLSIFVSFGQLFGSFEGAFWKLWGSFLKTLRELLEGFEGAF